jgi:hypothetical protein
LIDEKLPGLNPLPLGAYPLMYFAQEFIPLNAAILASSGIVLLVIAIRSATIMSLRLALLGTVLLAAVILWHRRFVVAMLLIPRMKREKPSSSGPEFAAV